MHEFESFPFDPASTTLHTLQSVMFASDKLIANLNSAHADEEKLSTFLKERVFSKTSSLHARIPLNFFKGLSTEKHTR